MKRTSICDKEKEHELTAQRAKAGIMNSADVEKLCTVFRMLADSTRMKIVLALMNGDMCVYHLTEVCDGTQSGVSHQLRVLRDNKIVKAKRLGQTMEYSIIDEHVREMVEIAIKHLACE